MKNKFLKTATALSVIALFISASMFNSEQVVIPTIVFLVSLLWVSLFALANGERTSK